MNDGDNAKPHSEKSEKQEEAKMIEFGGIEGKIAVPQKIILGSDGNDEEAKIDEEFKIIKMNDGDNAKPHSEEFEKQEEAKMIESGGIEGKIAVPPKIILGSDGNDEEFKIIKMNDGDNSKPHSEESEKQEEAKMIESGGIEGKIAVPPKIILGSDGNDEEAEIDENAKIIKMKDGDNAKPLLEESENGAEDKIIQSEGKLVEGAPHKMTLVLNEERDRLTTLPTVLLSEIFSWVSIKRAVRCLAVSPRLKTPFQQINTINLNTEECIMFNTIAPLFRNQVIIAFNWYFNKRESSFSDQGVNQLNFKQRLKFVADKNVKKISIVGRKPKNTLYLGLPTELFQINSLHTLILGSPPTTVLKLPDRLSLKSLEVFVIQVNERKHWEGITRIISCCEKLKEVKLVFKMDWYNFGENLVMKIENTNLEVLVLVGYIMILEEENCWCEIYLGRVRIRTVTGKDISGATSISGHLHMNSGPEGFPRDGASDAQFSFHS